jgi:hypothetical protein
VTGLPDSPAGEAAAWFVGLLQGAPVDGFDDRLTEGLRSLLTVQALDDLRAGLGDIAVVRAGQRMPLDVDVRLRAERGGDRLVTLLVEPEPPHRIRYLNIRPSTGDAWRACDGDGVVHRAHRELELAGVVAAVVAEDATTFAAAGPVDEHSRFSIGSITKTMTATFVDQLASEKAFALDAELRSLFDDVDVPAGITVRHALDHRSGLVSDAPIEGTADVAGLFARHPLRGTFAPGSDRVYSNAAYGLLGLLVERAGGAPYGDVLRERLFAPLGMHESGTDPSGILPGYLSVLGSLEPVEWQDVSLPGAGAVVSTAADLARYVGAVLDGTVKRVSWREEDDGTAWHTGGWDGFSAMAWLDVARRRGSVLLTNTGHVTGNGLLERYAPLVVDEVCGVD